MKMSHVSHIICDFYVRHGAFSFGYCATNESGLARHTWKWVMTHFYPRMHLESWLIFMCVRHIPFVPRTFVRRTFECNMYKTGAPGTVPRTNPELFDTHENESCLAYHLWLLYVRHGAFACGYCATNESRATWHTWKWVMSHMSFVTSIYETWRILIWVLCHEGILSLLTHMKMSQDSIFVRGTVLGVPVLYVEACVLYNVRTYIPCARIYIAIWEHTLKCTQCTFLNVHS